MALNWSPLKTRSHASANFRIPQEMHFLWGFLGDGNELPCREALNRSTWQRLNQGWGHNVHSPTDVDSLIQPSNRKLYSGLPLPIQRCDVARPILLKSIGGVYSDLDVQPYRDLSWLCGLYPHAGVILIEEVTLTRGSSRRRGNRFPIRNGQPELRLRVANFWMASVAGHPFWTDVMALVEERSDIEIKHDYDVIYTTGPDVISEAFDRAHGKYPDIALVPRHVARRFFRHRTHGSWRTDGLRQRWAA